MTRRFICGLAPLLLFTCVALCAQDGDPSVEGYVTNAGTPASFELNGRTVLCDANTITQRTTRGVKSDTHDCVQHLYGEHLAIFGKIPSQSRPILATKIRPLATFAGQAVEGLALIDEVMAPDLFRADGLAFRTTPATEIHWDEGLHPGEGVKMQQWVEYHGKIGEDGVVVASWIFVSAPNVDPAEKKLRDKNEFDPSAVTKADQQDPIAKFFIGTDYKRIPALKDVALQDRIDAIGKRLVPVYQSKLPDDDPNKINFRFQLVDKHWKQCVGLPSGVMLVPASMAKQLNDEQLAPIMAYTMVTILEKQAYRYRPTGQALHAIEYGGDVAGLLIPGFGLLTGIGTGISGRKIAEGYEQQGDRMSLVLLHDGGFDIQQAPLSWWRLQTDKPDFMKSSMPSRSAYLFQAIADFWNPASPLRTPPAQ